MKKILMLLFVGSALLLVYGCSQDQPTQSAAIDYAAYNLVERPQFIETRPPDKVEAAVLNIDLNYSEMLQKKPPKPPPVLVDPNPNPAHKYAYIVGISNYEGTANDLQYCDDDARAMKSWLQGEGFTCRMDLDLSATADNITAGLQWLIDNASPGDEIAFCYSGHGAKAQGYGSSIISSDLYYVTHGYVMSYLNSVNCTKKLTTLDACVIGDFHSDAQSGTFMATASNRKSSYDAPGLNHGAWTYYWLDGVEDVALIFAEEAAPYAEDGMKDWASAYHVRVDPKHSDKYDGGMDM
ncbi:MAG: hypothetical protein DRP47_03745 [Candidatus Zixiibacteriota bacterium]|nr:MAG: hypothetical protein DRP47_03745 [candidate division Zixibacteria bacterium]